MTAPGDACLPRPRIAARGRPHEDPGCAGCAQLPVLRTLRRAGLELEGGLGCDAAAGGGGGAAPARSALLAGARRALRDAPGLVGQGTGRRLLVVADRGGRARAAAVARALEAAGAEVLRLAPDAAEPLALALARDPPARTAAIVSLAPCARGAPRGPPRSVLPSRCSRCGACLGLGCVALSDPGGEAMEIDPVLCSGCGRCAPLCRGRAIVGG